MRDQAREKLNYIAHGDGDFRPLTSDDAKAVLAECERLRERAEQSEAELRKIGLARQEYERAMAECERLRAALKEPCAECGHIDWREGPLGEADALQAELERLQAECERLRARLHNCRDDYHRKVIALQAEIAALKKEKRGCV